MKKHKWVVFSKVLEFISSFEHNYNSFIDKKYWGEKMNMLMNNFSMIMQTLNEKKGILVKEYPNKSTEVERRIHSRRYNYKDSQWYLNLFANWFWWIWTESVLDLIFILLCLSWYWSNIINSYEIVLFYNYIYFSLFFLYINTWTL